MLAGQDEVGGGSAIEFFNGRRKREGIGGNALYFEKLIVPGVAVIGTVSLKVNQQDFISVGKTGSRRDVKGRPASGAAKGGNRGHCTPQSGVDVLRSGNGHGTVGPGAGIKGTFNAIVVSPADVDLLQIHKRRGKGHLRSLRDNDAIGGVRRRVGHRLRRRVGDCKCSHSAAIGNCASRYNDGTPRPLAQAHGVARYRHAIRIPECYGNRSGRDAVGGHRAWDPHHRGEARIRQCRIKGHLVGVCDNHGIGGVRCRVGHRLCRSIRNDKGGNTAHIGYRGSRYNGGTARPLGQGYVMARHYHTIRIQQCHSDGRGANPVGQNCGWARRHCGEGRIGHRGSKGHRRRLGDNDAIGGIGRRVGHRLYRRVRDGKGSYTTRIGNDARGNNGGTPRALSQGHRVARHGHAVRIPEGHSDR